MKDLYDAIVIGSGAGGGTAAYRLTRAGMKVLLLEQGPRYRPFRDYPLGRNDWERLDHFERHLPDSYVSSTQPLGAEAAPLMSGLYGRPLKRKPEAKFEYARAAGIGGSTLRYQAEVHRFPEHAFRMKSRFGIARDWPLTYGDLEPYYREAEELLGVAGDHRNPFKPPRDPFPMPAHPLGCPSRRVREGAAKLGLTLTPNSLAIPNRRYRGRPACIYCRACGYGCVIGDKGSVDVVMIKPAEATGMLTIQTGARVLRIEADRKGRAEAVLWKDGTGTHTSHGRAIVAAGGAIETPRLLLNSRSAAFPDGLANGGGLVGSSLMTHLSVMLMVFFDEDVKSYQGLPIDSRIWDFSAPERVKDQGTGFSLGVMGAPEGIVSPSKFALVIPGWGKDHRDKMKRFYGAHSAIFGVADQNPKETNTVRLAGTKDAEGMPKAEVHVEIQDDDLHALELLKKRCLEVAEACDVKVAGTFTSLDVMRSAHVGGTARMGVDPKDSVVNSFGQCHDVKNLFIADASVLVTQGCGDSPALTIMALALRTAEHVASELKKGNL